MKKRLFAVILIVILSLALAAPALAVVAKSSEYYVNDTANVLSSSLKQKIIDSNTGPNGLEQKCQGAQIVVVTVKYLDGMYADEYAMKLFNDWGVGNANGSKANNGMLLLLATEEKRCWLTVGAGISNVFTDNMANSYFEKYFYKEFDKGNYETAVSNMLEPLFSWYATYYKINNGTATQGPAGGNVNGGTNYGGNNGYYNDYYGNSGYNGGRSYSSAFYGGMIIWILIIVIIVLIFVAAVFSDRRRYRAYYTHMGMPIPTYYPWFIWFGPHRAWWYGPGGPGWRGGPRGPGGFGGPGPGPGPGPRGGGFGGGGRSGRSGGGFGGFGGGGGGFGGGGFGGFGGGGSGGGFGGGGGGFGGGGGGRR